MAFIFTAFLEMDIKVLIAVIVITIVLFFSLHLFINNIRSKTERKLREQSERIRGLVETSQDWIWEMDLQGIHTYSNPGVEKILGYSPDELAEFAAVDLIHEDDKQKMRLMLQECIKEKKGWRDEVVTWKHKDGSLCYLESNAVAVLDSQGDIKGFRGIDRDISPSKIAMEQLRESEKRYRTLFESANDAIFLVKNSTFIDCNAKTEEIFACSRDKLIGQTPFRFSPHKQPDGKKSEESGTEKIRAALAGNPQFFEWQHIKYNGKPFDAEVSLNLLDLPSGKHLLTIVRDVSQRKLIESNLLKSEGRFRRIVDDQTEFIVRWLPDGTRTFVNKSYCRYFKTTHAEALGTSFFDLIDEKDEEMVKQRIKNLTREQPVSTAEHRVKLPDGSTGWNRWTDRAIFDDKGQIIEYQSVGMDITQSKNAEHALRESEERFRILSESAFEGIVITEKGRVVNANKKLTEMLNLNLDALIGMEVFEFVAPESYELVKERMKIDTEEPYEHLARSKDGRVFPVEVRGKSMPYQGHVYRITAIREVPVS